MSGMPYKGRLDQVAQNKRRMIVYVKYSTDPPYLPLAVADSKAQLAFMLGMRVTSVYTMFSRKNKAYRIVEIEDED
jgi:hypothetical protein